METGKICQVCGHKYKNTVVRTAFQIKQHESGIKHQEALACSKKNQISTPSLTLRKESWPKEKVESHNSPENGFFEIFSNEDSSSSSCDGSENFLVEVPRILIENVSIKTGTRPCHFNWLMVGFPAFVMGNHVTAFFFNAKSLMHLNHEKKSKLIRKMYSV